MSESKSSELAALAKKKDEANARLRAGELTDARDEYFEVLISLDDLPCRLDTDRKTADELKIACFNNLMALFLKVQNFDQVVDLAKQVLRLDERNVKALFRKSQALSALHKYEEAASSLRIVLGIEPGNDQARELLDDMEKHLQPPFDNLPVPPADTTRESKTKISKVLSSNDEIERKNNRPQQSDSKDSNSLTASGWEFMNPEWKPPSKNEASANLSQEGNSWFDSFNCSKNSKHADVGRVFINEAERTKMKNQLFAEAIQKESAAVECSDKKKKRENNSVSSIKADEAVIKAVEDLSVEEKNLVAKVESKKKSKTHTCKIKKSSENKGFQDSSELRKKKVVSKKAKSEWQMLLDEEEDIKKHVASKTGKKSVPNT